MKLLLAFILVSLNAFAKEAGNIDCASESSVTAYSNSKAVAALTQTPVKVKRPSKHRGKGKGTRYPMLAVRLNLKAAGLLVGKPVPDELDSYYDDDSDVAIHESDLPQGVLPPPHMARDAGPWLYNNGFINLLGCAQYAAAMRDPKNIPNGAVVVYAGGHSGMIEIKTPSGWWSDRPRTGESLAKGMKVLGIFVKPLICRDGAC